MGKIFYIMGKSSTGKDTVFKQLRKEKSLELSTIVLYTTRPIRAGEKDGEAYHFIDEKELNRLEQEGRIIEKRSYDTVHGTWYYLTVSDEQIDLAHQNYIMIGTIESYVKTRDYFGEQYLVPVYIEVEDGIRLSRALNRERRQKSPKYTEMCRRFLADTEDFSEERIAHAGITKRFQNLNFKVCLKEIINYIKERKDAI